MDQALQTSVFAATSSRVRWLGVLCSLWIASSLLAQPVRFLIGVDVSYSTARSASAIHSAVKDVVSSGFMGQIRPGEAYGVWLYSERVQKLGFEVWNGNPNGVALQSALTTMARTKPRGRADFRELLAQMAPLARTNQTFTLVLVTDGEDEVRGTPFDAKINRLFEQNGRQLRQERRAFFVGMLAEGGYWVRHTVSETGFNLELPLPTLSAAAASLVEPKLAPARTEPTRPAESPVERPVVVVKPILVTPPPVVVEAAKPQPPAPPAAAKQVPTPVASVSPAPTVPTPQPPAAAATAPSVEPPQIASAVALPPPAVDPAPVVKAVPTQAVPIAEPQPARPPSNVSSSTVASAVEAPAEPGPKAAASSPETNPAPAAATHATPAPSQALLQPLPVKPGDGSGWGVWAFVAGLLVFVALWVFRSNVRPSGAASLISQSMDKDGTTGRPRKS